MFHEVPFQELQKFRETLFPRLSVGFSILRHILHMVEPLEVYRHESIVHCSLVFGLFDVVGETPEVLLVLEKLFAAFVNSETPVRNTFVDEGLPVPGDNRTGEVAYLISIDI